LDLKQFIGTKSNSAHYDVTEKWIQDFCSAIGRKSAHVAPPTFLTICRTGEFELFQKMGVPLARVLHAEQEYIFVNPIIPDVRLDFVTEVAQVLSKKTMHFMILETQVSYSKNGQKVEVGSARSTMVLRE
jgi:hypothetical protein